MASQVEIQHRLSYARAMLERGIPVSSLATLLSARYFVSRSTAYEDIRAAHQEIQLSDDGPAVDENPCDPVGVLAMLQHRFELAVATGDDKQTCQLIKAMDTAKKWQGYKPQPVSPFT
ncbi:putative recombinase [uncultured Mediterranean phage MEDS3 group]|nr:putative recombinase [uncultured Mediterranean phage MEDS3 group]BAR22644.1 putative recombinase [uncultured Mediterranean phage uvMED]BAR22715.1 putative recombinase [uncultured Mediterranean phage uvMED]BAR22750.1 putative recombinase [uncultured Mediterranean phage uvMED]BAR22793.1 putative recombinase [uncultured Mediterranean phage uvMED]